MSEMTMNMGSMYEEVPEIQKLNRVEGFDPRRYMRTIQDEGQPARYYLDVAFRKLWFRLKYPEGKIVKHILKLTDQVAIVEARVYLNRNDEPDNFISNALAQKYMTADTQFGNKYVELAETAAVGRALSDAGFGLQFADREGDLDPEVTEAPMERRMLQGGGMPEEENTEILKETAGAGLMQEASEEDVNYLRTIRDRTVYPDAGRGRSVHGNAACHAAEPTASADSPCRRQQEASPGCTDTEPWCGRRRKCTAGNRRCRKPGGRQAEPDGPDRDQPGDACGADLCEAEPGYGSVGGHPHGIP